MIFEKGMVDLMMYDDIAVRIAQKKRNGGEGSQTSLLQYVKTTVPAYSSIRIMMINANSNGVRKRPKDNLL